MTPKDGKTAYDPLTNVTDVPPAEEEFSLEEILAEYGGGREKLMRDVEQAASLQTESSEKPTPLASHEEEPIVSSQKAPVCAKKDSPQQQPSSPTPTQEKSKVVDLEEILRGEIPRAPQPISLEEVVGSTVDAVMEEEEEPLLKKKHRRGLFSRRKLEEETEEIYQYHEPEEPEPEAEQEKIGPEPDLLDAADDWRYVYRRQRRPLGAAFLISLLLGVLMGAEAYGVKVPVWTGDTFLQTMVLLPV